MFIARALNNIKLFKHIQTLLRGILAIALTASQVEEQYPFTAACIAISADRPANQKAQIAYKCPERAWASVAAPIYMVMRTNLIQ